MVIRTRDEAVRAVADWVELPERREKIVRATVEVMSCMDAGARSFLTDSMALLITGGLQEYRRKRREDTTIIILDPEDDALYSDLTEAFMAIRFADVTMEVFPSLRKNFDRWEVARAIRKNEASVRDIVSKALVARRDDLPMDEYQATVESHVLDTQPTWKDREAAVHKACNSSTRGHHDLFEFLACCDDVVTKILDENDGDSPPPDDYLVRIQDFLDDIVEAEKR